MYEEAESPIGKIHGRESLENPENLSNEELLKIAEQLLNGACYEGGKCILSDQFHEWFRWVQSDDSRAVLWWHWVNIKQHEKTSNLTTRDDYIKKLWYSIDSEDGPNRAAVDEIKQKYTDWSYYKNHFFHWFLARFNTVAARQIFNSSWLSGHIHLFINILSLFVVGLFHSRNLISPCYNIMTLLILTIIFMAGALLINIPFPYYLQSLMPRLAVTISIGYLFLMSASGLVNFLYITKENSALHYGAGIAIFMSIWLYLILVITKQGKTSS